MPIPPAKKTTQADYIKTALRLPPDLHRDLQLSAEQHGHSLNQEILIRLRDSRGQTQAELAEIKASLRKILDAVT
jgi:predicted HicB family RNase H-like nuclease